jgi:copper chaperone CopZ
MSTTREYAVQGMTCEHCKRSVTEAVSGVDDHAIGAAVEEAGYEVVIS